MIRRTPLKRSPALARRTPLKRKRSTPRRVSVLRDREYLDWLRERHCVACTLLKMIYQDRLCASGSMPIDPAHGAPAGMRMKGPDNEAIPLCRSHHEEQTKLGWPAFEQRHGIDRAKEAEIHYSAYLIWKEDGEPGDAPFEELAGEE